MDEIATSMVSSVHVPFPKKEVDLIFSLGPNCKSAWNLRSYFNFDRAYPFDWWITPAMSMLKMIEPGFRFHVSRDDLHITPTDEENTVYNYPLNILQHHDFPRDYVTHPGVVLSIADEDLDAINRKYAALFARMTDDISSAASPVAALNTIFPGWPQAHKGIPTNPQLTGLIPKEELAREVRDRFGKKLRVLFISAGEPRFEEYAWGWEISSPDAGPKDEGPDFSQPVHVFRAAYRQLNLSLTAPRLMTS